MFQRSPVNEQGSRPAAFLPIIAYKDVGFAPLFTILWAPVLPAAAQQYPG